MQKLQEKLKNVPKDTSLVLCSTNSGLNKDQSLSDQNKVLSCNNSEENQRSTNNQSLQLKVFVLNVEGKPLMPTKSSRARKMLESGKAKVVKRSPFTIQLLVECENTIQDVVLGIDLGYKNIGFSCITEKAELISGTLILENRMSERLSEKRMYRRKRRNKLWYREPRWLNRVSTKKEGWLAPSVQRRLDTHIKLVERLKKILPISKVRIEVANFDIQKIDNPEIEGTQYQQGNLFGYENIKQYIIHREEGKCQFCKKEYDSQGWHLHHIKTRSKGGTDKPNNLALLHQKCHKKLHKEQLFDLLKKPKEHKAEIFMSIIRWKVVEQIKQICNDVEITFGYKTKIKRIKNNLEKTHYNDAFVIANGNNQSRTIPFEIIQKKRNNRCLQLNRKGFKPSIRRQRYKIQPQDIVWIGNKEYISKGIHCKGTRIVLEGLGSKSIKLVTKYFNTNSWRLMRMHSSPC